MTTILGIALLVTSSAHAGSCPDPEVDATSVVRALDEADAALVAADLGLARQTLGGVGENLPCLDTAVERRTFARFARLMSTVAFYQQDPALAVRWGHASELAFRDLPWALEEDHPLRTLLDDEVEPPLGRVEGFGLAAPKGGGVLMNGSLVLEPRAHAEVPYFVQVLDSRARVVGAYWQDGAAFPEEILVAGGDAVPRPAWYVDEQVVEAQRVAREGGGSFPVVPTVVSGGLALTSVLTYLVAGAAQASMPEQSSAEGLTGARSKANAFTLVSGLAAAGAVGVGVGGVFLSPDGLRLDVRF